jgi:hypothetical protein
MFNLTGQFLKHKPNVSRTYIQIEQYSTTGILLYAAF